MPRIASLPTRKDTADDEKKFLTQPSSWAKLGALVCVVLLVVWINVKEPNRSTDGTVAGVSDERVEETITKSTEDLSSQVVDTVSQVQDEAVSTIEKATEVVLPPGPSDAEVKTEALLGSDYSLQTLLTTGKTYLDQNKLSEAETLFTRATEVAEEYRDAWYLLGYTQLKEYEQRMGPPDPFNLSKAQWAVVSLTRALSLDPQADHVKQLLDLAKEAVSR